MSYVELKSLYKIYKQGQNEVFALNGLSAVIDQGEFLAILGPSRSGKSTLLHILGGLDSPTKGSVIVDGTDISEYSDAELAKYRRKTVGFVFQSFDPGPEPKVTSMATAISGLIWYAAEAAPAPVTSSCTVPTA